MLFYFKRDWHQLQEENFLSPPRPKLKTPSLGLAVGGDKLLDSYHSMAPEDAWAFSLHHRLLELTQKSPKPHHTNVAPFNVLLCSFLKSENSEFSFIFPWRAWESVT